MTREELAREARSAGRGCVGKRFRGSCAKRLYVYDFVQAQLLRRTLGFYLENSRPKPDLVKPDSARLRGVQVREPIGVLCPVVCERSAAALEGNAGQESGPWHQRAARGSTNNTRITVRMEKKGTAKDTSHVSLKNGR